MKHLHRVLPLLASLCLAAACDDVEYEAADGTLLGEGLSDDLDIDTISAELHPSAAGYCDNFTNTVWPAAYQTLESQVITEMNKRRTAGATCGGVKKAPAAALTVNGKLRCAARRHSKDMRVNNFFSHTGSNGSTPWDRIKAAGYVYTNAAENIAAGQTTALAVVNAWMASTGHCNNIMNPVLKEIGVGYDKGGSYGHYWTQDFGKQ